SVPPVNSGGSSTTNLLIGRADLLLRFDPRLEIKLKSTTCTFELKRHNKHHKARAHTHTHTHTHIFIKIKDWGRRQATAESTLRRKEERNKRARNTGNRGNSPAHAKV